MKHIYRVTAAVFFTVLMATPSLAQENCKRKEAVLERKLAIAKSHGNTHQVAGLEEALARVRLYCSDESLLGKAEMKVEEKREKVFEREADLQEARQKGDAKKISKREKKLTEAREELAEAERKRDALKK